MSDWRQRIEFDEPSGSAADSYSVGGGDSWFSGRSDCDAGMGLAGGAGWESGERDYHADGPDDTNSF